MWEVIQLEGDLALAINQAAPRCFEELKATVPEDSYKTRNTALETVQSLCCRRRSCPLCTSMLRPCKKGGLWGHAGTALQRALNTNPVNFSG